VRVSARGIEFNASGDDIDPDDAPEVGCVSTRNELVVIDGKDQPTACNHVFDLAKVQNIRVIAVGPDDTPAGAHRSGYHVFFGAGTPAPERPGCPPPRARPAACARGGGKREAIAIAEGLRAIAIAKGLRAIAIAEGLRAIAGALRGRL
jgi:hypothetical protein